MFSPSKSRSLIKTNSFEQKNNKNLQKSKKNVIKLVLVGRKSTSPVSISIVVTRASWFWRLFVSETLPFYQLFNIFAQKNTHGCKKNIFQNRQQKWTGQKIKISILCFCWRGMENTCLCGNHPSVIIVIPGIFIFVFLLRFLYGHEKYPYPPPRGGFAPPNPP